MVQNPGAYDRRARAEVMGDVRLTEDVFENAFGGINETYVAVSDRDGRRVRGARSDMGVPVASYPRHVTYDLEHLDRHGAPPANHTASSPCESDRAPGKDQSSISINRSGRASAGRMVNGIEVEGDYTGANTSRGQRNWETMAVTRPRVIDIVVANTSASTVDVRSNETVRGRANSQVSGGAFSATMQQSEDVPENKWPLFQQGNPVPGSASAIGGLGFDEELSQATRRVKQLQMSNDRCQALQLDRSQRHNHGMLDAAESLIDFGIKSADSVVGTPKVGQISDLHLKKVESLIDYELDEA